MTGWPGGSSPGTPVRDFIVIQGIAPLPELMEMLLFLVQKSNSRDFPGGPVAKTGPMQGSQCRGPRFDPWSGN